MGTCYAYRNHDKAQYFDCGLACWNNKRSGLGCGPGARAMGLLLCADWSGDRISVENDSDSLDWQDGAIDIEVDVVLMLLETDGVEWLDVAGTGFHVASALAIHLRHPALIASLDKHFGPSAWKKRHADHVSRNTRTFDDAVHAALARGIVKFSSP